MNYSYCTLLEVLDTFFLHLIPFAQQKQVKFIIDTCKEMKRRAWKNYFRHMDKDWAMEHNVFHISEFLILLFFRHLCMEQ